MKNSNRSGHAYRQAGFTLIEMLVVVAIVGLLSSVVVVGVGGARQKARDAKRVADMRSIQTWAEAGYVSAYPDGTAYTNWTGKPVDPLNATPNVYTYAQCTGGQSYVARTVLEATQATKQGLTGPICGVDCSGNQVYCVGPSS